MVLATLLLCAPTPMLAGSGVAGHTYSRGVQRFVHSGKRPIDFRVRSTTARDRIRIYDVTYASALSGRVPAYVVIPDGKGPFAAVLFAHWAMEGSQTRNRTEFLDEAVALAHAGAVCLLPDAPFARPGQKEDSNPLSAKSISMFFQQILDLRRGIEILTRRADVDKTRIGFVGHSYDANAGGVLAGVDKRLIQSLRPLPGSHFQWRDTMRRKESQAFTSLLRVPLSCRLQPRQWPLHRGHFSCRGGY